jgi:hypothetical protein
MILRNDFVKQIESEELDHLFPLKKVSGALAVNTANYYRVSDISLDGLDIKYVSETGSDATGDGSIGNPWRTVSGHMIVGASTFFFILSETFSDSGSLSFGGLFYNYQIAGYNKRVELQDIGFTNPGYGKGSIIWYNIDFKPSARNITNDSWTHFFQSCSFFQNSGGYKVVFGSGSEVSFKGCYIGSSSFIDISGITNGFNLGSAYNYIIRYCWTEQYISTMLGNRADIRNCYIKSNLTVEHRLQRLYNTIIEGNITVLPDIYWGGEAFIESILLKGSYTGVKADISRIIEVNNIELSDDFWNVSQPEFQIREKIYTFADIGHTFCLDLTNRKIELDIGMVNRFDYSDDTDSERQVNNATNINKIISFWLDGDEYRKIQYSLKKGGYFILSDFDRAADILKKNPESTDHRNILMSYQQGLGYFFQLNDDVFRYEDGAETYKWEGYIAEMVQYESFDDLNPTHLDWIYIEKTIRHLFYTESEWFYRFQTINAPSDNYRVDNPYNYVYHYPMHACIMAYKLYTLYDFKVDDTMGEDKVYKIQLTLKEKRFDSVRNNLLITAKAGNIVRP